MKTQRHPYRPYVWITQHKPGWVYHYSPFICCRPWAVISSWPHCALWLYHPRGILIRASRCYSDTLPTAMRHSFNRKMCDIFKITNPQIFFFASSPSTALSPWGIQNPKGLFKSFIPGPRSYIYIVPSCSLFVQNLIIKGLSSSLELLSSSNDITNFHNSIREWK